jgi:hypothetical protein
MNFAQKPNITTPLNPEDYKGTNAGFGFNTILFQQLASCMYYGSICGTDKAELRKFERAVKMLEVALVTKLSQDYKDKLKKLVDDGQIAISKNRYNDFYECIRLRLMYLMKVLSGVANFMPEERAMEKV